MIGVTVMANDWLHHSLEVALGYVRILNIMLVVEEMLNVTRFPVWYLLFVYSLAPVIYIYIYFVVTLTIIHERPPPTLDDGLPSDTVGREDDGGFLGPQ